MLDLMKLHRVTAGGQISLPAEVRHRWGTKVVAVEDLGDHVVVRPLPEDPVAAARGALKGRLGAADDLRAAARRDEAAAQARR
jgi:bifunctional DNA-binding transcriptional regulator/antitoxin component of YhaV-PrlF toxin-antitoxin module